MEMAQPFYEQYLECEEKLWYMPIHWKGSGYINARTRASTNLRAEPPTGWLWSGPVELIVVNASLSSTFRNLPVRVVQTLNGRPTDSEGWRYSSDSSRPFEEWEPNPTSKTKHRRRLWRRPRELCVPPTGVHSVPVHIADAEFELVGQSDDPPTLAPVMLGFPTEYEDSMNAAVGLPCPIESDQRGGTEFADGRGQPSIPEPRLRWLVPMF